MGLSFAARHNPTGKSPGDWRGEEIDDLLSQVRGGSLSDRRREALSFDWNRGDLSRLGWIMAQKGMDLGTATRVFLNGEPAKWRSIPARQVPPETRPRVNLLDTIHRRIMAGFYLPDPELGIDDALRAEIRLWVGQQETDAMEGRIGRWQFRIDQFEPLALRGAMPADVRDLLDPALLSPRDLPRRSLWRDLLAPLLG